MAVPAWPSTSKALNRLAPAFEQRHVPVDEPPKYEQEQLLVELPPSPVVDITRSSDVVTQCDGCNQKPTFCELEPCGHCVCRACLQEMIQDGLPLTDQRRQHLCGVCRTVSGAIRPLDMRTIRSSPETVGTDSCPLTPCITPRPLLLADKATFKPQLSAEALEFPCVSPTTRSGLPPNDPPSDRSEKDLCRDARRDQALRMKAQALRLRLIGHDLRRLYAPSASSGGSPFKEPTYPVIKVHNVGFDWTVEDLEAWVISGVPGALPSLTEHGCSVHLLADPRTARTRPFAMVQVINEEMAKILMATLDQQMFKGRPIWIKWTTPGNLLAHVFPQSAELFLTPDRLYSATGERIVPTEFEDYLHMAEHDRYAYDYASERPFRCFASALTLFPWSHIQDAVLSQHIHLMTMGILRLLFRRIRGSGLIGGGEAVGALLQAARACRGFDADQKSAVDTLVRLCMPHHPLVRHRVPETITSMLEQRIYDLEYPMTPIATILGSTSRHASDSMPVIRGPGWLACSAPIAMFSSQPPTRSLSLDAGNMQTTRFPLPPRPVHDAFVDAPKASTSNECSDVETD